MPNLTFYDVEESNNMIRFIRDDRSPKGDPIYMILGNHSQSLMVQPPARVSYALYTHNSAVIRDIIENIEDIVGERLPEGFYQGTALYNVHALLNHFDAPVSFRVLRQQMFLGSKTTPYTEEETARIVFHVIGNALWNYFDYRYWRLSPEVKEEYCELRGLPKSLVQASSKKKTFNSDVPLRHQQNIFYIGAEDFRYLYGTAQAGRNEWYLDNVAPPSPDVINFWKRELGRNAESNIKAEVPVASIVVPS